MYKFVNEGNGANVVAGEGESDEGGSSKQFKALAGMCILNLFIIVVIVVLLKVMVRDLSEGASKESAAFTGTVVQVMLVMCYYLYNAFMYTYIRVMYSYIIYVY